jgi:hypothetical protein
MTLAIVSAIGEPVSDYDVEQENIVLGDLAGLIAFAKGERWATTEYDSALADADAQAGKYLTVGITGANQGKLIASATATSIKSAGYVVDNGHKLLAFEIVG